MRPMGNGQGVEPSWFLRQDKADVSVTSALTALLEGARDRSTCIQLSADDQVAREYLIGQILQKWQRCQDQSSYLDS